MAEESLFSLLKKAKSLERSRYLLYRKCTSRVYTRDAKDTLLFLMKSEKHHLDILEEGLLKLKRLNRLDLRRALKGPVKPPFNDSKFREDVTGVIGDINIIEGALQHEREDPIFYSALARKTKRNDAKKLFLTLKKQEIIHIETLKRKLNSLRKLSVQISEAKGHKML